MRVFKFGGASIATAGRMVDLLPVIKDEKEPLILVVSALGKTTNALENIVALACSNKKQEALDAAKRLEQLHLNYAHALLDNARYIKAISTLSIYFTELETGIEKADASRFDYSYDQIVCLGEIFSTLIFSFYLHQTGIVNEWVDARKVISTDNTYRDGEVNLALTKDKAEQVLGGHLSAGTTVITQGFIGASADGSSVTLGREGSDYTAAILAALLQAESVTIWKDVAGLLNADPKMFPNTRRIEAITYNEVIEMAFYGAQIIHPKTIKPLQNANIPLYVKCFLDPSLKGTVIQSEVKEAQYPPLIVLKLNQVLLQVTTRDFSFITEDNLSALYAIFHQLKVKINLIQNAAISFIACIDDRPEKVKELTTVLNKDYKVLLNDNVSLLTVRHFTPQVIDELTKEKQILLKQETRKTLQTVMKA